MPKSGAKFGLWAICWLKPKSWVGIIWDPCKFHPCRGPGMNSIEPSYELCYSCIWRPCPKNRLVYGSRLGPGCGNKLNMFYTGPRSSSSLTIDWAASSLINFFCCLLSLSSASNVLIYSSVNFSEGSISFLDLCLSKASRAVDYPRLNFWAFISAWWGCFSRWISLRRWSS